MQSERTVIVRPNTNRSRLSAVDTLEVVLIFSPSKAGVRSPTL